MELSKAVSQIQEIHEHLAKGEVYRGFRAPPLAASGVCALIAPMLQPHMTPAGDPVAEIVYWVGVAAVAGLIGGIEIFYNYLFREDSFSRRRTRKVLGQFLPCLMAGAAITAAVVRADAGAIPFLPGIWALLFGLGIFAARPYLPRATGWVALFYFCAGCVMLLAVGGGTEFSHWGLGVTFGVGQIAGAIVLYWNLERKDHVGE
ncbi:MAG: hypothetical protein V2A74_03370 [bacterium]